MNRGRVTMETPTVTKGGGRACMRHYLNWDDNWLRTVGWLTLMVMHLALLNGRGDYDGEMKLHNQLRVCPRKCLKHETVGATARITNN